MTTRRNLLVAIGASAFVFPVPLRAQAQKKIWRIGFLWEIQQSAIGQYLGAFKSGLLALGYAEGRDYVAEQRISADIDRLPALAAELLALKVDVIVSSGTPSAVAAHNTTRDVPILITTAGDPLGSGLAVSFRRPGGNVTGLTGLTTELYTKRLDLLRQMLPGMRRVGFLYHPDNSSDTLGLRRIELDCAKLKLQPLPAPVRESQELAAAFNKLKRDKAGALIVSNASTHGVWLETIVEQALKHRLPAIYGRARFPDSGGLISYSTDAPDLYRRAAGYADKIFKGVKPGELPIEQPMKFETVINLKTAKALGLKIPDVIMLRADRVIE
jgi:putative ABC transport system substrate-binding protein